MSKVRDIKAAKSEPQKDVVLCLEKMLERAKAGFLYSVVIVAEDRDGGVSHGHAIDTRNVMRLIGALEMMKNCLLQKFCEDIDS